MKKRATITFGVFLMAFAVAAGFAPREGIVILSFAAGAALVTWALQKPPE